MRAKKKRTALVVDDEEGFRDLFFYMLVPLEFEVQTARDGQEALELIERQNHHFDIVFLDIHMPKMTGFEVLKAIKLKNPSQPVVMLSSSSDSQFIQEKKAKELGAHIYLQKPFEMDEILKILRDTLGDIVDEH